MRWDLRTAGRRLRYETKTRYSIAGLLLGTIAHWIWKCEGQALVTEIPRVVLLLKRHGEQRTLRSSLDETMELSYQTIFQSFSLSAYELSNVEVMSCTASPAQSSWIQD